MLLLQPIQIGSEYTDQKTKSSLSCLEFSLGLYLFQYIKFMEQAYLSQMSLSGFPWIDDGKGEMETKLFSVELACMSNITIEIEFPDE